MQIISEQMVEREGEKPYVRTLAVAVDGNTDFRGYVLLDGSYTSGTTHYSSVTRARLASILGGLPRLVDGRPTKVEKILIETPLGTATLQGEPQFSTHPQKETGWAVIVTEQWHETPGRSVSAHVFPPGWAGGAR